MIRNLASCENRPWQDVSASMCVIGSGPAGVVATKILSEAMNDVIVLESGASQDAPEIHSLNTIHQPSKMFKRAEDGRQRLLGGTSATWGGCLLPMEQHGLDERPYLGLKGWPISVADLAPFLHSIEDLFQVGHESYAGDAAPEPQPRRSAQAYPDLRARLPKFPDVRHRSLRNYLASTADSKNVTVWSNATVCDFELDTEAGRIVAVLAKSLNGRTIRVKSDVFIVSCGTLESTRLLLLLDRMSKNRIFAECDALGRYFNDHLKIDLGVLRRAASARVSKTFLPHVSGKRRSVHLELAPEYQRRKSVSSGYLSIRFDQLYRRGTSGQDGALEEHATEKRIRTGVRQVAERFAPSLAELSARMLHRLSFGVLEARIEQVPQRSSRITLADDVDALGVPLLSMDWIRSEQDNRTFSALFEAAQQYWSKHHPAITWKFDTPDRLIDSSIDTCHPAGSARMGWCRRDSVVDRDMRCHNVQNLYVAGAAVFPTSGSVNPTLSIMQLSAMVATRIKNTFS